MIKLDAPPKNVACAVCGKSASAELIIGPQQQSLCCDCLMGVSDVFAHSLIGPFTMPQLVIPHFWDKMPKERARLLEQAKAKP